MKRNDHFWSVSILLVLLEPVNGADFKYVFVVWIGRQIREKTSTIFFCLSGYRRQTIISFRPKYNRHYATTT